MNSPPPSPICLQLHCPYPPPSLFASSQELMQPNRSSSRQAGRQAHELSAVLQSCWDEKPQNRPSFTSVVSSLKRMANDLRPQRRASAPGGDAPAKAVPAVAQPFAQAQPISEPPSPHAPAAGLPQPGAQ